MDDQYQSKGKKAAPSLDDGAALDRPMRDVESGSTPRRASDYAAQMARAAFGRHYIDAERIEQTLKHGEIVFQHKTHGRRGRPR